MINRTWKLTWYIADFYVIVGIIAMVYALYAIGILFFLFAGSILGMTKLMDWVYEGIQG